MHTSRLWRGTAVAVAAVGLAGAGTGPAVAATAAITSHTTTSGTSGITINTKSAHQKVSGNTLVVYRSPSESVATVSGTISDATYGGQTATLWYKGYKSPKWGATSSSVEVTAGSGSTSYSFRVKPAQETDYQVRLSGGGSSGARTVYVTPLGKVSGVPKNCARPVCHVNLTVTVSAPPAAIAYEMHKRWFLYSGLNLSLSHKPAPPYWLHLNHKATVTKPRKTRSYQFQVTVHYAFRINGKAYKWRADFCTKDVVRKDGIGVPGHHGCGDPRIRAKAPYLG